VLFEVPKYIADGLADASMVRRGGVIQWAAGQEKSQVVAWLRESGGLQEHLREGSPLPPSVATQLSHVGVGGNVMLGLQALTLASVAIGFAVVNAKLNVMDRKLDAILRELAAVRDEVSWLDRRHDVAMVARLRAALDAAVWAEQTGRLDALPVARTHLLESEHHLDALLAAMLTEGRAHRFPHLFGAYCEMLSLAGVGRAHLDGFLDGPRAGERAMLGAASRLGEVRASFQQPLREFDAHSTRLLTLPAGSKGMLGDVLAGLAETRDRLAGYATEFAFCEENGLPYTEWRRLEDDEARPAILVLEPRRGT
jgi:hypothetical protein